MCWVVFEVTVGSSNFPRRFHPKVFKGLSGFNEHPSGQLPSPRTSVKMTTGSKRPKQSHHQGVDEPSISMVTYRAGAHCWQAHPLPTPKFAKARLASLAARMVESRPTSFSKAFILEPLHQCLRSTASAKPVPPLVCIAGHPRKSRLPRYSLIEPEISACGDSVDRKPS